MRSLTRGTFTNARKTIRAHRSRSYMTMLGIIIGIASVVTIVSIGAGIKQQVARQIGRTGASVLTIRPGTDQSFQGKLGSLVTPRASGALNDKDIAAVRATKSVVAESPVALVSGTVKAKHGSYTTGPVVAAGNDLPKLLGQSVAFGTFFIDEDAGENIAVIGEHAAQQMFDREVPLGQTFTFRGQEFMVRGVFSEFPPTPLSNDVAFNDAIVIPYTTAQKLTNKNVMPYEILAKAASSDAVPATSKDITSALLKVHGGTRDFSVLDAADTAEQTSSVLDLITQLIAGAALIALFVGGIGIMNITLVSVTERLHEIGIRKAVGATNRQILNEFIAEATLLSVTGAIIGIFVSLVINIVLRVLTSIAPVVQWQVLVGATVVSMVIGIVFGSVPALKAARKDPIAALRGE